MNNAHWLKERYKNLSDDDLEHEKLMLVMEGDIEVADMHEEQMRRKLEALKAPSALIQEDTP